MPEIHDLWYDVIADCLFKGRTWNRMKSNIRAWRTFRNPPSPFHALKHYCMTFSYNLQEAEWWFEAIWFRIISVHSVNRNYFKPFSFQNIRGLPIAEIYIRQHRLQRMAVDFNPIWNPLSALLLLNDNMADIIPYFPCAVNRKLSTSYQQVVYIEPKHKSQQMSRGKCQKVINICR